MFGYTSDEMLGSRFEMWVPSDRLDAESRIIERLIEGESFGSIETTRTHRDGRTVPVLLGFSINRDHRGDPVAITEAIELRDPPSPARDTREARESGEILELQHSSAPRRHAPSQSDLEDMQERLSLAQRSAGVGLWERDFLNDEVTLTPELEALYGLAPQEFDGTYEGWRKLVHPDDIGECEASAKRAIEDRSSFELHFRFLHRSGEVRWMVARGRATYDSAGRPLKLFGANVDVTAARRAEAIARESNDRLRVVLECVPTFIWSNDSRGHVEFMNKTGIEYFGYSSIEAIDSEWPSRIHPEDAAALAASWSNGVATKKGYSIEARMKRHDGVFRWCSLHIDPILDEQGSVTQWYGSIVDIHERIELREALQTEHTRFRQIVDVAPGVICSLRVAADGSITFPFASPRIEGIYELTPAELARDAGLAFRKIHPDDLSRVLEGIELARSARGPWHDEFRVLHSTKGEIWIEGYSAPVFEADGGILWHGILMDVTERVRAENGLRDNEARFRSYIEHAPLAIFVTDDAGRFIECNPGAERLLGLDATTIRGMDAVTLIVPEDRGSMMRDFRTHRGGVLNGEYRMSRPDGQVIVVSMLVVHAHAGHRLAFCQDVSERRRTERALQETATRYLTLIETAHDPIFVHRNLRTTIVNQAFVSLIGAKSRDELLGRSPLDFVHPDDHPMVRARLAKLRARESVAPVVDARFRRLDGLVVLVEAAVSSCIEDHDVTVHVILRDVTERRRAELELRTSRAQLIAALEAGQMGTWVYDVASDSITWDDSMMQSFGFDRNSPRTVSLAQAIARFHEEDRERLRRTASNALRSEFDCSGEFRIVRSDGRTLYMAMRARIERDSLGRPVRMIGISMDVTDRRLAEESRARSQKLEALGTLASGIAHDFNNVLLAIGGNSELAMDLLDARSPSRHHIQEIRRASARATDLVRRILAFTRGTELRREVIDLAPVIDEATRLLRATTPARIAITSSVPAGLPHVFADATQIHQIVVNLGSNAAYAIGERTGSISIALECELVDPSSPHIREALRSLHLGRHIVLSVKDDGSGIESEIIDRIFDPFFTTKPQGEGSGLGLSVVHGIVRNHGGAIDLESSVGAGTIFRIYFPVAEGERFAPATPQVESAPAPPRSGHVMYVDDEPSLASTIPSILRRLGYSTIGFTDPVAALEHFKKDPKAFDAVVTDEAMPVLPGFELARQLLALRSDLPVILTSGMVRPSTYEMAKTVGIREVLLKPYSMKDIQAALQRVVLPNPS